MTDRRRSRFRRRSSDHLMGGAGIALLFGAAVLIGVDAANRGGLLAGGGFGLDGNRSMDVAVKTAGVGSTARHASRASMLPGEIVVESTGNLPEGEWRLEGRPMPAPPVVLDSVSAGEHRLTFNGRDSVSWDANVTLEPGGIAHVVVPELAPAPAAVPTGTIGAPGSSATPAAAFDGTTAPTDAPSPVPATADAPADSTQQS